MGSIWKIFLCLVQLCMLYHSGHGIECHDQESGKLSVVVRPPCPNSSYNNATRIRPTMLTQPTEIKYTPLQVAAMSGNLTAVREALDRGDSVDERNARGDTALHLAATAGHVDVVNQLGNRGANVNIRGHNMRTPLICAAENRHGDIVQYLLSHYAYINAYDINENTALIVAVRGGFINVIKDLMNYYRIYGVSPDKMYLMRAAIIESFEQKQIDIVKEITLSKYMDKETSTACLRRIWNKESFWILADVVPDDLVNTHKSVLKSIVKEGRCDALQIIGDAVTISQPVLDEAIDISATEGFCIKELVVLGANVNSRNGLRTPLYTATYFRHYEVMKILLDAGADPNIFESKQYAPLAAAINRECLNCTKLLLERGGAVKLQEDDKHFLSQIFRARGEMNQLLLDYDRLMFG